jgi:hypothetical protein
MRGVLPLLSLALGTSCVTPKVSLAQAVAAPTADDARHYYDFWPGTWYELKDGVRESQPTFTVSRGVQPAAYVEEWRLTVDGREDRSQGLRVWDPATSRWAFVWTNSTGLFQIWDSVQVGKEWYIQRPFDQNGKKWLSRQAWIPDGPDKLTRILERSDDGGRTWLLRAKKQYIRGRS